MITGGEAATVAKAGASIAKGLMAARGRSESEWPDAREALMELFIILDDWCESAEQSNKAARRALESRVGERQTRMLFEPATFVSVGDGGGNVGPHYVERTTRDIETVLNPPAPWAKRWRRSKSRAAARRTLRSMLRIYCPDLLESFEEAVTNRATWITEHRRTFTDVLTNPRTPRSALGSLVEQLETTLRDLRTSRDNLRNLIHTNYPTLSTGDPS